MRIAQIEEQITSYWEALREGMGVPYRSEVDPRGLEGLLEYMFIVERLPDGQARLRVAGMHLNRLMGMEVRGMDLRALFVPDVRVEVARAFEQVFDTPACMSFDLCRRTGRVVALPLRGPTGAIDRAMGCIIAPGGEARGQEPERLDIGHVELRPIETGPGRTTLAKTDQSTPAHLPGLAEPPTRFQRPANASTAHRRPVLRVIRGDGD